MASEAGVHIPGDALRSMSMWAVQIRFSGLFKKKEEEKTMTRLMCVCGVGLSI